jgi:hypothetical protein
MVLLTSGASGTIVARLDTVTECDLSVTQSQYFFDLRIDTILFGKLSPPFAAGPAP